MPTELQKRAMRIKIEKTQNKEPIKMAQIMLEAGYTKKTAHNPTDLTESKGWAYLKAKYLDDEKALQTFSDLAAEENEDKDNRLKASIEIMKLNDRYPAQKSKIIGLFDKISALEE